MKKKDTKEPRTTRTLRNGVLSVACTLWVPEDVDAAYAKQAKDGDGPSKSKLMVRAVCAAKP